MATTKQPTLVVLQLTGGNDALNTVVPYADGRYYDSRKTVRIAEEDVLKIEGMTPEHADVLMGFLTELTEENEQGTAPAASKGETEAAPESTPAPE